MNKTLTGKLLAGVLLLAMAGLAQAQQGDAEAGADKIMVCLACHGESGNTSTLQDPNATVPKIGGQSEKYLLKQMREIKSGVREVPLMSGMLNNLDEQDMADVAAYYASQDEPRGAADPGLVEQGERIYRAGIAEAGVPACSACHSPTGSGNAPAGYPALSGQLPAYTASQLRAFQAGERLNDEASVMRTLTERMTEQEIEAVASYIAGLR